jgi:hypothetical protein
MFATWTYRIFFIFTLALSGCASQPKAHPTGALDFSWKLSGDRSVAPLQVFSDATHIWLQWQPNQTIPAIFGVASHGEQLVPYERQGPYTKLEAHWTGLVFRGAHRQARARRPNNANVSQASSSEPQLTSVPQAITPAVSVAIPDPAVKVSSVLSASVASHTQPNSQAFYAITNTDKNLRQALSRWSGLSGWRFQVEHWAVDVDIPLTATANFSDDFVGSVRALIEATELSERPLQPCFYTNQVLRVVPITEACDRTLAEGARV